MTDQERLRRAIEDGEYVGDVRGILRDEVRRLRMDREYLIALLQESLDDLCYDQDKDTKLPLKEACYCTDTGTDYGTLLCLPCRLVTAIANATSEPATQPSTGEGAVQQ